MKRKDAQMTIKKVGARTFLVDGSMTLLNKEDGTSIEVDMPSLLSIIRGVLKWCNDLLDDDTKPELSTVKNMHTLLAYVGGSIAYDISSDEEDVAKWGAAYGTDGTSRAR